MKNRLKLNIQYFDTGPTIIDVNFYSFGQLVDTIFCEPEGASYQYIMLNREPTIPTTQDTFVGYRARENGVVYTMQQLMQLDMPVAGGSIWYEGWSTYDFDAVFNINRLKIDGDQVAEMKIDGDIVQEAKIDGQIVYGNGVY